ncbi:MAG: SUMF1/EgtB/PvdO family nonheme iron enzyme [Planctomycetota bacterium]
MDSRRKQALEIYRRLIDTDVTDRTERIAGECGSDSDLRRMVTRLLRLDEEASDFLSGGSSSEQRVGPYKILEKVGAGGMGVVYLAETDVPVSRRVALKVIHPGLHSEETIARFRTERQAISAMQHPNVATVYDPGTLEDGRPYFAMEYVEGLPITEFCDEKGLDFESRVEIFQQVLEGVQHAHQKGVIHRDLKPSNILVSEQSGSPLVKIIDFGIAKAVDPELERSLLHTEFGRAIGTPYYMSPEQTVSASDVDTRSDVYSLGVVLYELLVGDVPFDRTHLAESPVDELFRCVREVEPPTPSHRLRQLDRSTAQTIADRRREAYETLSSRLRGDLDWITMKAIEKEAVRRYATVSEFAADLGRYLRHEVVQAGPPDPVYVARKFVRRHRVAVTAGTAVFIALLVGLISSLTLYSIARDNEDRAASHLEEVLRLSEREDVRRLVRDAEHLWPASSDRVPVISGWLEKADSLLESGKRHLARLAELRSRALPWSEEEKRNDRETHPSLPALQEAKRQVELQSGAAAKYSANLRKLAEDLDTFLESGKRDENLLAEVRTLQAKRQKRHEFHRRRLAESKRDVDRLTDLIAERRTFRFEESKDRWWHEQLTLVAEDLRGLESLRSKVRVLKHRSASLKKRSLEDPKELWREAAQSLLKDPRFDGFRLEPQEGLLPLRQDPQSKLWEFFVLDSGSVPTWKGDGAYTLENDVGIVLVLVPGGTAWVGAEPPSANRPGPVDPNATEDSEEGPTRELVFVPFFLSKYELTQSQWLRQNEKNPSFLAIDKQVASEVFVGRNPVERITWEQSTETLRRFGLVLPTEAQWEYAHRAGTTDRWWTGANSASLVGAANVADAKFQKYQSNARVAAFDDGFKLHAPVGSLRANPWGLHDTIGNVREWCRDEFGALDAESQGPDHVRVSTGAPGHVYRGGGFADLPAQCRASTRKNGNRGTKHPALGARGARAVRTGT